MGGVSPLSTLSTWAPPCLFFNSVSSPSTSSSTSPLSLSLSLSVSFSLAARSRFRSPVSLPPCLSVSLLSPDYSTFQMYLNPDLPLPLHGSRRAFRTTCPVCLGHHLTGPAAHSSLPSTLHSPNPFTKMFPKCSSCNTNLRASSPC